MLSRMKIAAAVSVCSVCVIAASLFSVTSMNSKTADAAEISGTAMLIGSMGDYSQWGASSDASYPPLSGSQIANITGDGTYTVSFSVSSGTTDVSKIEFLCLQISDMSSMNYPNLGITINSVSIDGQALTTYKTSADNINLAYNVAGDTNSRVFFTVTNGWGVTETEDIPSSTTVTDNITVEFTVTGTAGGPIETKAATNTTSEGTTSTNASSGSTETSLVTNAVADNQQAATTVSTTSVDNSTTGDKGVIGIAAAGVLAACIAAASFLKRR